MAVCHAAGIELGLADPALPYWAIAWPGGLAIARYLADHPAEVAGRHIIDVASGSGLCAIVALRFAAASSRAYDVDPLAVAAIEINAKVNGVRIGCHRDDPLRASPPPCDVILAGDVCYEEAMAGRMIEWLRLAAAGGTRVLIGDPGRAYLPPDLEPLATYEVVASREIEAAGTRVSTVFTIKG